MYPYLIVNNVISSHQSSFKGGDSCINQLLSITHKIYKSYDEGFEVRGVFLDISEAFDRVWHDGLIFKLQENGISCILQMLLKDFLKSRKQQVVLNGQHSSWRDVNAGVSQGLILGLLLFLVYINNLPNGLKSNPKLFADDTSLFSVIHYVNNVDVGQIRFQKHLGMFLDFKLSFNEHLETVFAKVNRGIAILRKLQMLGLERVF